jgi:plastocyanin
VTRWAWISIAAVAAVAVVVVIVVLATDDDDGDTADADVTQTAEATEAPDDGEDGGDGGNGEGDGGETGAATVGVTDNAFSPQEVEVAAGTTVTWVWSGANEHSVIGTGLNSGDIESDVQSGSGSYEFTFEEAGTYEYQCGIHGTAFFGLLLF